MLVGSHNISCKRFIVSDAIFYVNNRFRELQNTAVP